MEYSFEPYQNAPFLLIFFILSAIGIILGGLIAIVISSEFDARFKSYNFVIHWSIVGVIVLVISIFGYTNQTKHDNIKVIGTRVDQYEQVEMTSGKTKRAYLQGYVVYKVPEGEVSFRRSTGVVYPQYAIIYMNKKQ